MLLFEFRIKVHVQLRMRKYQPMSVSAVLEIPDVMENGQHWSI